MFLFECKKDLQGYKAQSPLQREMFSLTENTSRTTTNDQIDTIDNI